MVAGRLSRRAFLGASAATLAGLGLGGCGAGEPEASDDLTILSAALDRERAAAAALAALAGTLDGDPAAGVRRAAAHDRAHAARLEYALRERGGTPARGAARAPGPAAEGGLERARAVKERAFAAYLADMAELRSPALRRLTASIAAVEAEHAAALRAIGGGDPLAGAFVMGAAR